MYSTNYFITTHCVSLIILHNAIFLLLPDNFKLPYVVHYFLIMNNHDKVGLNDDWIYDIIVPNVLLDRKWYVY